MKLNVRFLESSSSSKDSYSHSPVEINTVNAFKKRPRDSMYLATPVINTSKMNGSSFNYMRESNRRHEPSPSTSSITSPNLSNGWSASNDDNVMDNDINYNINTRERLRTQSIGNRLHKKPPLPTKVTVRAKEFHSSADMLSDLTDKKEEEHFMCGDFESTGMYSVTVTHKRVSDYGSNPSIPHSFSSYGISDGRLQRHSPNTIRRLEQLSLSQSAHRLNVPSNRTLTNSYLENSFESEDAESWPDIHSEETLV